MYFELNEDEDIELYTVEVEDTTGLEESESAVEEVVVYEQEPQQFHQEPPQQRLPPPRLHHRQHRSRGERQQQQQQETRSYQHKFTAREKWILVELVDHCKSILISKSAKSEVRKRKIQLWNEIADEINAQCGRNRLPEHLKKLWEYMASRARKAYFERVRRQPGDPPVHCSPLIEKIISIVHGVNINEVADEEQEEIRAVEVEQVDGDVKIDWYKVYNKRNQDEETKPRSVVEDMRRLLLSTHAIKPRRQPNANNQHGFQDFQSYEMEPPEEVTYESVLEAHHERIAAQRRMMEARELMYAVKVEAMAAKKMKMEAENYNLTLETLKMKHFLGELNLEFGDLTAGLGGQAQRANPDPGSGFEGFVKTEKIEPDDDDDEIEM